MNISKELSDLILRVVPQLKEFGIFIGYSHPLGAFLEEKDNFIVVQNGVYNIETNDFEDISCYLIESNEYEKDYLQSEMIRNRNGKKVIHKVNLHVMITSDLSQKTDSIINFIIDLFQWLKDGKILLYKTRTFKNYEWTPCGCGEYDIKRQETEFHYTSYIRKPDFFDPEDEELKNHIESQVKTIDFVSESKVLFEELRNTLKMKVV